MVRRPGQAKAEKPGSVKEAVLGSQASVVVPGQGTSSGHNFHVCLEADMG